MLHKIEKWIDQTLDAFSNRRQSCEKFTNDFSEYHSVEFLSNSYYVIVDDIPKPDFPELRVAGLGGFIDMPVAGITYKNTYFITPEYSTDLSLHFHELVHVLQWQILGAQGFIQRYMTEIQTHGYNSAPLELMAYYLQDCFEKNDKPINMAEFVKQLIDEPIK